MLWRCPPQSHALAGHCLWCCCWTPAHATLLSYSLPLSAHIFACGSHSELCAQNPTAFCFHYEITRVGEMDHLEVKAGFRCALSGVYSAKCTSSRPPLDSGSTKPCQLTLLGTLQVIVCIRTQTSPIGARSETRKWQKSEARRSPG